MVLSISCLICFHSFCASSCRSSCCSICLMVVVLAFLISLHCWVSFLMYWRVNLLGLAENVILPVVQLMLGLYSLNQGNPKITSCFPSPVIRSFSISQLVPMQYQIQV